MAKYLGIEEWDIRALQPVQNAGTPKAECDTPFKQKRTSQVQVNNA